MKTLILIGVGLVLFSWFVMDEKRSIGEKVMLLVVLIGLYVAYRLMNGATMDQILAPLLQ